NGNGSHVKARGANGKCRGSGASSPEPTTDEAQSCAIQHHKPLHVEETIREIQAPAPAGLASPDRVEIKIIRNADYQLAEADAPKQLRITPIEASTTKPKTAEYLTYDPDDVF